MTRSSEARKKQKANVMETTGKFRTLSVGGARLGMIEILGRLKMPSILAAHSKKRKEIVQYHPPRGRP